MLFHSPFVLNTNRKERMMSKQPQILPSTKPQVMSLQGHYRLSQTMYFTAMIPPLGLAGLCAWLLPQLPPITPEQLTSYETPFLGFCLLSAVLCDTMFYLRLRRFKALPTPSELAEIPSSIEVKKGWRSCVIAWGLVQIYALLGVMETFFTRQETAMLPFMIFAAITMFRCRPRHGLFAEFNWGTPIQMITSDSSENSQAEPSHDEVSEI